MNGQGSVFKMFQKNNNSRRWSRCTTGPGCVVTVGQNPTKAEQESNRVVPAEQKRTSFETRKEPVMSGTRVEMVVMVTKAQGSPGQPIGLRQGIHGALGPGMEQRRQSGGHLVVAGSIGGTEIASLAVVGNTQAGAITGISTRGRSRLWKVLLG